MIKRIFFAAGLVLLAILPFAGVFLGPSEKQYQHEDSYIIRVRIARVTDTVNVSSEGKCDLIEVTSGVVISKGLDISKGVRISVSRGSIRFDGQNLGEGAVRVSPEGGAGFIVNGIEYGGELDIYASGGYLQAVNRVGVEDYLKGVVPREVYQFWPMEALKAQAVASRSYAIFESLRRKKRDYDVTSDTFTQVYGGRSSEKKRTTKAVMLTRGEVLECGGKILPGYFHSSCGGHTARISSVWGGPDLEPLRGIHSPYCRWSPPFRWRSRVPTVTIMEKLNSTGYGFDRIDDIRMGKVDSSSRLEYVKVKSRNKWFEIPVRDFTAAIGASNIKSSNFRIRKYPLFYDFDGYGWGHGVGMCQWCAFGLSIRGWDHKRILEYFYPGAEVSQERTVGLK